MRERLVTWALVAVLGLGLWYAATDALEQRGAVTELTASLKKERARTARVQALVGKVEAQREKAQSDLDAALAVSKEWADSPAPAAVASELCKRLRCK